METTARDGFTLVELLMIIGIIGIAGCIAVPTIMQILPKQNLRSTVRDIHSALTVARSEAGRRNTFVTVMVSPDQEHTYKVCVDNGKDPFTNKSVGKAGNGICDEAGNDREEVLQSGSRLPNRVVFNPRIGPKGTNFPDQSVSFTSRGLPTSKGLGIGSIGLCTAGLDGEPTQDCRKLTISAAGRVSVSRRKD